MNDDDNSITLTIREYGAIEYDREQLRSQLAAMTAERDEARRHHNEDRVSDHETIECLHDDLAAMTAERDNLAALCKVRDVRADLHIDLQSQLDAMTKRAERAERWAAVWKGRAKWWRKIIDDDLKGRDNGNANSLHQWLTYTITQDDIEAAHKWAAETRAALETTPTND